MKLSVRYTVGAGLLAAAALAGCSALERGIDQLERGFDQDPPMSYSDSYSSNSELAPMAEPLPPGTSRSIEPPTPATRVQDDATFTRQQRPTDFLIEPQQDNNFAPPPAPAPRPLNGQPAASRTGGTIRPICFTTSSCCDPCMSCCDPCPTTCCDPCMTSCCDPCGTSCCSPSLLSRFHQKMSDMRGRMHCFKARVKSRLSGLNPFSCCKPTCCDPCASCCVPSCDPCMTCCDPCGGGVILEGTVVGTYPAGPPMTYGQPYMQQPVMNHSHGVYAPQAPCNCNRGQGQAMWQPAPQYQPQYAQPQMWQGQQHAYAPQHNWQQPQQYAAPQAMPHAHHHQPQVAPPMAQPGNQPQPQPNATPANGGDNPGTALLSPGYSRTVPVSRHLQTTYSTYR